MWQKQCYMLYFSDPESGLDFVEICLGRNPRSCGLSEWKRYPVTVELNHQFEIPNGVPAWIRLRVTNRGICSSLPIFTNISGLNLRLRLKSFDLKFHRKILRKIISSVKKVC